MPLPVTAESDTASTFVFCTSALTGPACLCWRHRFWRRPSAWACREIRAEAGQFAHDDLDILGDVFASAGIRDIHQMHQQPGALDMAQELIPKPAPYARLRSAGDVGDHEADLVPGIADRDHSEIRLERREWIVRDLRPRRRNARDQRGLARIRKSDQTDIGQKFQFQPEVRSSPGLPSSCSRGA